MSKTWAKAVLDEIDERGDGLTEWEIEFCASIRPTVDAGAPLSERQVKSLAQIHEDRVPPTVEGVE